MANLNFGFNNKGISQRLLVSCSQVYKKPNHAFLNAVYGGLQALVEPHLLEQMNPAEILGVSAGFYCAGSKKITLADTQRPETLYESLISIPNEHFPYKVALDRIDDESFSRNVRPFTTPLAERLQAVKLPAQKIIEMNESTIDYFKNFSQLYNPCKNLWASGRTQKKYAHEIFRLLESKYALLRLENEHLIQKS